MAFDCLPHDIIIAKLNAYGFDMKALNFIYDYLRNRKQRTKIDNAYGFWQNILYGVPQGSILGSLLFNIDLCDLFFVMNHEAIANYADDNTPYLSGKNIDEVVRFLAESSRVIFKWFSDKQFQANASKCHVLLSTDEHVQVKIGAAQFENNSSSFYEHQEKGSIDGNPLIWMFHSRKLKNKINKLHELCLRIVFIF